MSLYRNEYSRAREWFHKALQNAPDDPRVLEGLGETSWRTGNIPEAQEFLSRAYELTRLGLHPERLMAIDAKLAQVLVAAGQYQPALDRIEESLAHGDRFAGELLLSRSQCYLALAKGDQAADVAEAALAREPASNEARLLLAQALISLGSYVEALKIIDEALQSDPQRPEILLYKAQALLEGQIEVGQGRRLLARYAERAGNMAVSPDRPPAALVARGDIGSAQYFLSELYRAVGYADEALKAVEKGSEDRTWNRL